MGSSREEIWDLGKIAPPVKALLEVILEATAWVIS